MVVDTPGFGYLPNFNEFNHYMENFATEMFRFTDNSRIRSKHVNILHFGTDLDGIRHETDRIVSFMTGNGFTSAHDPNPKSWSDADMIIIGSDAARHEAAYYVARINTFGWIGLVPYWDMLWYGTDYTPQLNMAPGAAPLCSGRVFSMDGICLVHAHIRRRDDTMALSGAYGSILTEIESHMDEMMGTWDRRTKDKIKAFRNKVTHDGRLGSDTELFFAAVDVLQKTRHIGMHPLGSMPKVDPDKKGKELESSTIEFDRLAKKYKRPFRPPRFVSNAQVNPHATTKWRFSIARMAVTWIVRYSLLSSKVS